MPHVSPKTALLLLALTAGCEAHFTDLRPADSGVALGPPIDAGFPDIGPPPTNDETLLEGTFSGRGSYRGSGGASIVQRTDGTLELVFADDFEVSSVPGPIVVLSTRPSIGNRVDESQGDINLGVQKARSGAQTYPVPPAALDAMYVWIYCRPYGVEVARAELMEAPE
jgi:hypothetical protein